MKQRVLISLLFITLSVFSICPSNADTVCNTDTTKENCTCAGWGWISNTLGEECDECADDQYSTPTSYGYNMCLECPENFYCTNGTKTSCPTNSTSNAGATSIDDCTCNAGYKKQGEECTLMQITCASGRYLPKSKTECSACPAKSHCEGGAFDYNTTKDQGIIKCPTGYYCPAESSNPTECPAGSTSDEGSDAKTDCYMNSNTRFCDANGENCVSFTDIFITEKINYNLNLN